MKKELSIEENNERRNRERIFNNFRKLCLHDLTDIDINSNSEKQKDVLTSEQIRNIYSLGFRHSMEQVKLYLSNQMKNSYGNKSELKTEYKNIQKDLTDFINERIEDSFSLNTTDQNENLQISINLLDFHTRVVNNNPYLYEDDVKLNIYWKFQMGNLDRLLKMREELQKMGDFENCLDGVIGEMYAIEKLNMIKTDAHTKGIDGYINNKSVQVKTKGGKKIYRDSQHYIQIKSDYEINIDLLLMVFITNKQVTHRGPFERNKCIGREYKNGIYKRYYLSDMK